MLTKPHIKISVHFRLNYFYVLGVVGYKIKFIIRELFKAWVELIKSFILCLIPAIIKIHFIIGVQLTYTKIGHIMELICMM